MSAVKLCLELDDPVHQGVLGRGRQLTGQEEHRAIRDSGLGLQFVDELFEGADRSGGFFDDRKPVEDHEAGIVRLDFAAQQVQHSREAVLLEHTKGADVIEAVGDDRFFEKAELPDMQQHPRMILGQQGDIERAAAVGDMMEADLVAEDRLAGSGRALDDKEPAAQKAAAQNRIQPRHSGRD